MATTIGKSSPKRLSNSIEASGPLTLPRLMFLLLLGALIVVLHETFRFPLNLPGRHGIEAMGLLVFGRLICTYRWSATIVAFSAATTAFAFGSSGHDGWSGPILDLAPGVFVDLVVMAIPPLRDRLVLALPVFVALAFATKPLMRFAGAEWLGMHFGSLRHGVLYPISTHLMFGFAGALVAVLMWLAWARVSHNQRDS